MKTHSDIGKGQVKNGLLLVVFEVVVFSFFYSLNSACNVTGSLVNCSSFSDDSIIHYRLSEDKICRFYAEYLLRQAGRVSNSYQ